MEYFALILFIIGISLLFIGLFIPGLSNKSNTGNTINNPIIPDNSTKEHLYKTYDSKNQMEEKPVYPHIQMPSIEEKTHEESSTDEDKNYGVKVHISEKSPSLYEKNGYLYIDHSSENSYTGKESTFNLHLLKNVHRAGKGKLIYTGIDFKFSTPKEKYAYNMNQIDHIAFYPNCFVIVQKNSLPSALIFLDETKSLRNVLETFRIENVPR